MAGTPLSAAFLASPGPGDPAGRATSSWRTASPPDKLRELIATGRRRDRGAIRRRGERHAHPGPRGGRHRHDARRHDLDVLRQTWDLWHAGRRDEAIAAYERGVPLITYENKLCGLMASEGAPGGRWRHRVRGAARAVRVALAGGPRNARRDGPPPGPADPTVGSIGRRGTTRRRPGPPRDHAPAEPGRRDDAAPERPAMGVAHGPTDDAAPERPAMGVAHGPTDDAAPERPTMGVAHGPTDDAAPERPAMGVAHGPTDDAALAETRPARRSMLGRLERPRSQPRSRSSSDSTTRSAWLTSCRPPTEPRCTSGPRPVRP